MEEADQRRGGGHHGRGEDLLDTETAKQQVDAMIVTVIASGDLSEPAR